MDLLLLAVIAVIALALLFDFTNGFHDAANSVATVVATRALPAKWAPLFSATFNFLAYFVVGTAVANTIAKTVKAEYGGVALAFAALFAAIVWNYVTWRFGLPSSSSHAIIGGLVGAGIAAGGLAAIDWGTVDIAALGLIVSPAVAFSIAFVAMYVVRGLQRAFRMRDDHPAFKGLQLVSAAGVSFGHGANDAQKTMGVIAALLLGAGYTEMSADGSRVLVPEWVALAAYAAIALGTLWGGWRIIETMGLKITRLHASSGAAANIGATTAIFGATAIGMPISTTQAAATSILGAGVGSRKRANWRVVGHMAIAWIITIPAAGLAAFLMFHLTQLPTVWAVLAVGSVLVAFAAWAIRAMMTSIGARDVAARIPTAEELSGTEPPEPPLPEPTRARARRFDTAA